MASSERRWQVPSGKLGSKERAKPRRQAVRESVSCVWLALLGETSIILYLRCCFAYNARLNASRLQLDEGVGGRGGGGRGSIQGCWTSHT